ncbi:MAG: type III pantothenate kinase [Crocinitomicaceae bacterium]
MEKSFLVVDIGNTNLKAAYFIDNELHNTLKNIDELSYFIKNNFFDFSIISSVGDESLTKKVISLLPKAILASSSIKIPINILYKTPSSLGMDRLANAIAANYLHPKSNVLVIDVGTCLKFDFVDLNNSYLGGSISPGIRLRFQSLHDYTEKLPLIEKWEKTALIGTTTNESILSGVINGMESEIFHLIQRYQVEFTNLFIILTGGDAKMFDLARKNDIFAHENLTLLGLKLMLEANV